MARFVFNLEAVLTQRKHVEQARQRDLAVVQAQMSALQNELKAMNDSVQSATNDLRQNHLTGKLDMGYLAAHRRFTIAVQRQAITLMQKIALVQRQVEDAQKALAEAAKHRKAIEKLREKHHERWKLEIAQKEMAALDEVGMQLAYRANEENASLSS
jgi:flagellar FliJ protein